MTSILLKFYLRHEKAALILGVTGFFLLGYLAIALHTAGGNAHSLATPLDAALPYVPEAWPLYHAVYLLLFIPTRLYSRPPEMRRGAAANIACMTAAYAVFLLYPVGDASLLNSAGLTEATASAGGNFAMLFDDRGMNCFPSLHVALATIAAFCCARADRRLGMFAWTLTGLIAVSSLLLKRHYIVDLPAGFALGAFIYTLILRDHLGRIPSAGRMAAASPAAAS
ncbi:MAG: phosphatase PAP2 family protein [Deltaproteobacteria bacterium]|nr:phosphatase PAP2 family protein [Deltaproteobacteria bacterium]